MRIKSLFPLSISFGLSLVFVILTLSQMAEASSSVASTTVNQRTGAWVDTIHLSTIPTASIAIDQLEYGSIDFYSQGTRDPILYERIKSNPELVSFNSGGSATELTFNPAGPVFTGTGKLNPFDIPEIREAVNWLIDRNYVVDNIYDGLAMSKFTCIRPQMPDYARYQEVVQDLESYYAYDPIQAQAIISTEMNTLGAYLANDIWHYNSEPVTLTFLIRVEDERTQIGDYIADQFESIGFPVDRQYMTSSESSALWAWSNPEEGLWHLYTGAWGLGSIDRDEGWTFQFYYTPQSSYNFSPLWQAYTPDPVFETITRKLNENDYTDVNERNQLFSEALEMSLLDSSRIWIVDNKVFNPHRSEMTAAYDLGDGLKLSDFWPLTVRYTDTVGGVANIAQYEMMVRPWNQVGGSTWSYDRFVQRALRDDGLLNHPISGLPLPQRVASATLFVQTGLPVTKTLDWVTLTFSETISVPDDTWVDWDENNELWITAADKFTETQYAQAKSVVHYPSDLFTSVTWHDGSPLSVADFIMSWILPFDLGMPGGWAYDESLADDLDRFMANFKGYRITSIDPLVIEYYTDGFELDAERIVRDLWPEYGTETNRREGAWHNMLTAWGTDVDQELAFTEDKANSLGIPWMDFLSEPSISLLYLNFDFFKYENWIPYEPTLGAYISPAEAAARYTNLDNWYSNYGHFWIGTGPFYLETFSKTQGTMTLQRYPAFPDPAGRWDHFNHDPTPPSLKLNYDSGAPGSAFNIIGENYPINSVAWVSVNGTDVGTNFTGPTGDFTTTLTTDPSAEEGTYIVKVSVNPYDLAFFELISSEPIRPVEGDYKEIAVSPTIHAFTDFIYLPISIK